MASRANLISVLSNLDAILIRATVREQTTTTKTCIRDVSLDTAVKEYTQQLIASDNEECLCPEGYHGTSCEVNIWYKFK